VTLQRTAVQVVFSSALLAACSGGGGGGAPAPDPPGHDPTATPTATPASSPGPCPAPSPTGANAALVAVSASTNAHAFAIVLQNNGSACLSQDGIYAMATASGLDSAQFFSDLNANSPLANVATDAGCPKSVSFGTTTELTYEGSTSGDVSCAPSPASPAASLYNDTLKIENDISASVGGFNH
jgi:hypothetical protein